MRITIIGAGKVGRALGAGWQAQGHTIAFGVIADHRMGHVRFVATGNQHRRTVLQTDISHGKNDIALASAESRFASLP